MQLVALLAQRTDGATWLVRGEGSLFGGLWGCPLAEGEGRALAQQLARAHGLVGKLAREPAGTVEHVLTHRALSIEVYRMTAVRGEEQASLRCVSSEGFAALGIAKLTRKIVAVP